MDPEGIMLSKIITERQILYDFTYTQSLKYKTNKQIKQKQTHKHREQTDDFTVGEMWGMGKVSEWKEVQTFKEKVKLSLQKFILPF